MVLINWMNTVHVDVYSDQEYRYALLLAHLYPDVHFYAFTPEKMNATQELFKNETGIYRCVFIYIVLQNYFVWVWVGMVLCERL